MLRSAYIDIIRLSTVPNSGKIQANPAVSFGRCSHPQGHSGNKGVAASCQEDNYCYHCHFNIWQQQGRNAKGGMESWRQSRNWFKVQRGWGDVTVPVAHLPRPLRFLATHLMPRITPFRSISEREGGPKSAPLFSPCCTLLELALTNCPSPLAAPQIWHIYLQGLFTYESVLDFGQMFPFECFQPSPNRNVQAEQLVGKCCNLVVRENGSSTILTLPWHASFQWARIFFL